MGLRDKASKMLDAIRRGSSREAVDVLGDALDDARVRLMDEVVSRISGHPVHTAPEQRAEQGVLEAPVQPSTPPTPAPVEVAAVPSDAPTRSSAARATVAPTPPATRAPATSAQEATTAAELDVARAPATAPEPEPALEAAAAPEQEAPDEEEPARGSGKSRRRRRRRRPRSNREAPAPEAAAPPPVPDDLPEGRLVLMARDPTWAFAHWEVPVERIQAMQEGLRDPQALLRFYEKGTETPIIDADVTVEAGSYYLRVPRPGRAYEARLVLVGSGGEVRELVRSNGAEPPADAPGPHAAPQFVRMDAQREVLAQLEVVDAPPPRLVMDVAKAAAEAPARMPRDARWAAVMAELRARILAEGEPLPTS